MQAFLEVSHSRVSQHLSVLRSHRVVVERREGRHVFYRLLDPRLAQWLLDGIEFLKMEALTREEVRVAVDKSKELWANNNHAVSAGQTN